jgi:hypothetical protein
MTEQSGSAAPLTTPQSSAPKQLSDTQPLTPFYAGIATILGVVVVGGLLTVALSNAMGIKTPLTGVYQWSARLNLLLPSTADARGGCQALGGISTWAPRGLAVHTLEGGYCSFMEPPRAVYLSASYRGAKVISNFPGQEEDPSAQR